MKMIGNLWQRGIKAVARGIVTELDGREKTEADINRKILDDRAANQLHWATIYRNAISSAAQTATTIGSVVEASNAVCDRMEKEANSYRAGR